MNRTPEQQPFTALRRMAAVISLLGVAMLPAVTHAGICGDDVQGTRIACRCGDVVVSDTKLLPADPVLQQRCPLDGLILAAAETADTITLDLAGTALRGSGYGTGIRVLDGGTDGALVIGGPADRRGEIAGFEQGLVSNDSRAVRRIEHLLVHGNREDGLHMRIGGALLINVDARHNGGDGIQLRGEGGRLEGVTASENKGNGVRVLTRGLAISARATGNSENGIIVDGLRNELITVEATGNEGTGVVMRGRNHKSGAVDSRDNAGRQIRQRRSRR